MTRQARARNGGRQRSGETLKRVVDVLFCLLALPVVVPLLVLVALAVRIDTPGPAVFRQPRTGRDGTIFKLYKFRTMVLNAETLKASLMHLNTLPFPDFKIPNDPRITRVGRFLRKTSLDELPQILNILRGEMSWVGPRPTSFRPATYQAWHGKRLEARPGLTGLWQVKMRGTSTFDERVRLDCEYLRNPSLSTDLWVMLLTATAVFKRTGV